MTDKKILIIIVFVSLFILFGGVLVLSSSSSSSPSKNIAKTQNAKAEASETSFDWGQIDYNGPKATKTFKIKNVGTDTLKLNNIKTSCTCTSAQVIINQKGSPFFSMHSNSSWIGEVQPGKEAELAIRFDQSFHGPSGVGPIERIISVETNDANNPKLEFILKGYVVKS